MVDSTDRPSRAAASGPGVAVAAIVSIAMVAYAVYGYLASVPRFLLDELYYLEAGTSLAQGDGLRFRGDAWGYGPVFPTVIAGVVRLTASQETSYGLVKLLGAVAFALALIPVYLLARRYVPPWFAVGVVGLMAFIPSTTYVSLVMTESLSFLVVAWTVLLMVKALERPTLGGQLGVMPGLALAVGLRTQFLALAVAWPVAIVLMALVTRDSAARAGSKEVLRVWWPTAVALLLGGAAIAVGLLRGGSSDVLGAYDVLLSGYSPLDVALSLVRQIGGMALFLVVVPFVAAAVTITRWLADARAGDTRKAAFVALFVPVNAVMLAVVSVFAASDYAVGHLHDRKLFYLYPLWLVLFAAWLADGLPRPRRPVAVAGVLVVAAVALLPFREIAAEEWLPQHEAPGTELWGHVGRYVDPLGVVIVGFALLVVAAVTWLPRRWWMALPVIVVLVVGANTLSAWRSGLIDEEVNGAGPRGSRNWVDRTIGDDARATLVFIGEACREQRQREAGLMTLFYNRAALDSVVVGHGGVARPISARLDRGRRLVLGSGEPLATRFVITQPGVVVDGRRLASGSPAGLVLWETDGTVRLSRSSKISQRELCPGQALAPGE